MPAQPEERLRQHAELFQLKRYSLRITTFCGQELLRANLLSLQKLLLMIFSLRERRVKFNVFFGLSDGVMVTQRPLEALFMVRIHVGQPNFPMKTRVLRMFAQNLHNNRPERLTVA